MVSDVEIDKEKNEIRFNCKTTGTFALTIPKYAHFPFKFWEIDVRGNDSVKLFIRTSLTEIIIRIDEKGLCTIEEPFKTENSFYAPALFNLLQSKGINLVAPKLGEKIELPGTPQLSEKTKDLEDLLSIGLADSATGFRVRSSKWNSSLQSDRATLLVEEVADWRKAHSDDEENENQPQIENQEGIENQEQAPPPPIKEKSQPKKVNWKCILIKEQHISEIPYTEDKEDPSFKIVANSIFHQHLLPMFFDFASEEVRQRVKNAPGFIGETLFYLIQKTRLFSYTS